MTLSARLEEAASAGKVEQFQKLLRQASNSHQANLDAYQKLLGLYDMGHGMKADKLRKIVQDSGADKKRIEAYLIQIDHLSKPPVKPSTRDVYGGDPKKRPWGLGT